MPAIALVDLTFHWPPTGGCWIDLQAIGVRLREQGWRVKLFTPDFSEYYPRGTIKTDPGFEFQLIPFNRYTWIAPLVRRRFRRAIDQFDPDIILLGDGYQHKAHLLEALADYPLLMRFYSYELVCLNLHLWRYDQDQVCDNQFLKDPCQCHQCWFPGRALPKRTTGILLGMADRHPKLHFSQEYIGAGAWTKSYREHLAARLRCADALIVYNSFMRNLLAPYHDRIEVIPSGIDTERFVPAASPPAASGPVRILLSGRANDPLKGLPETLTACRTLRDRGIDLRLLVTAAMDLHLDDDWVENLGWMTPDQLPELYRRMDICLVPSRWIEPFGITTLEAMACGLPVIAARIGGLAETVQNGVTGLHFQPGDAEDLTRCLQHMVADPDLRARLGQAGRERTCQLYRWDDIVSQRYLPLLDELRRV